MDKEEDINNGSSNKRVTNLGIPDLGDISKGNYPKFTDMETEQHINKVNEIEREFWRGKKNSK